MIFTTLDLSIFNFKLFISVLNFPLFPWVEWDRVPSSLWPTDVRLTRDVKLGAVTLITLSNKDNAPLVMDGDSNNHHSAYYEITVDCNLKIMLDPQVKYSG